MHPHLLPSPETLVFAQLRLRWLAAIEQLGPQQAREDAIQAFVQRMRCSHQEAQDLVDRAWTRLSLRDGGRPSPFGASQVAVEPPTG